MTGLYREGHWEDRSKLENGRPEYRTVLGDLSVVHRAAETSSPRPPESRKQDEERGCLHRVQSLVKLEGSLGSKRRHLCRSTYCQMMH